MDVWSLPLPWRLPPRPPLWFWETDEVWETGETLLQLWGKQLQREEIMAAMAAIAAQPS